MKAEAQFKANTEKFVREALSEVAGKKPSEQKVRKATNRIIKAFEPIVLMTTEHKSHRK